MTEKEATTILNPDSVEIKEGVDLQEAFEISMEKTFMQNCLKYTSSKNKNKKLSKTNSIGKTCFVLSFKNIFPVNNKILNK